VHLDIIKDFYSPTDAQVNFHKNNFKIYIKIDIKTAPTSFGAVTPSSGSALRVLVKVTVVKIVNSWLTRHITSHAFPNSVYFRTVQRKHTKRLSPANIDTNHFVLNILLLQYLTQFY
jgi:hypothetical protein